MIARRVSVVTILALVVLGGVAPAQATPIVTIDDGPNKQTKNRKARFAFSSDDPVATFECRLDEEDFASCPSPTIYRGLERGRHAFQVRAISLEGAISAPASQKWKIAKKKPKG